MKKAKLAVPYSILIYMNMSRLTMIFFFLAELPDPVKNCTAFNVTSSSLQVQCLAGKNGGIPQQFHVEVVDLSSKELLVNVSFKMPEFLLKRLPSDTEIVIKVGGK